VTGIIERIDAALQKASFRQMEVRAIYLDDADDAAFVKAVTRYWRKELKSKAIFWPTEYRGHHVRKGSKSRIYSTHGVEIAIPKRLSPRVQEAA
jgi:hypothetical protein